MKVPKPKLNKISLYKILLYYSTILSTILIIGGFYTARSGKEIISNLLFLPIVVFLWLTLIQKRRENKPTHQKSWWAGKKILTNNSGNKRVKKNKN